MIVGAIIKVIGGITEASGIVEVVNKAYSFVMTHAQRNVSATEAKSLFGINQGDEVAYRHDSVHPLFPNPASMHPDNLSALLTAAGDECRRALEANKLLNIENLTTEVNTNLVLIGSPTAEGLSRPVFGYFPIDADSDSLYVKNQPVDLPYKWILDKSQISDKVAVKRYIGNGRIAERPNWRIEGNGKTYIPSTDANGFLKTDYLLVTRMRNYLSQDGIDSGKYIVSFGGTHGTSTRAINILLKDRVLLNKIADTLQKKPEAFQILFRITRIVHNKKTGSYATKIELAEDPVILDDNYSRWREALKVATSNFSEWIQFHHKENIANE